MICIVSDFDPRDILIEPWGQNKEEKEWQFVTRNIMDVKSWSGLMDVKSWSGLMDDIHNNVYNYH